MAALMRFSRFASLAKQITKLSHFSSTNTPTRNVANGCIRNLAKRRYATRSESLEPAVEAMQATAVDKLAYTLEGNIRRYGRISCAEINGILREVEREGAVSKNNSLLIMRCLGSFLYDELPESRTKIAEEIWDKLQQLVQFDVTHYNALLRVYIENGHDFSPTKFLSNMEAQNISPNRVTFQRLIERYCKQGDIQAATQILDHMKQVDLPINDQVFTSFIHGHFKAGEVENAKNILNIMQQSGLEPNGDTYTALMCGYATQDDFDSIKQTIHKAEMEGIMFRPQHLLEVLTKLTMSGHTQRIDEMMELLNRGPGYNQNAIKCVTQLVAHGHDEVAYKVYLSMVPPQMLDQQEMSSGRFLLRAQAKFERPLDVVAEQVKDMNERKLNKDDLSAVAKLAFILKKTGKGLPIRSHYFWPAICQHRDNKDINGVVDTLSKLMSLCDTRDDSIQTLHEYAIPALLTLGQSPADILEKLMGVGYSEEEVNFSVFLCVMKKDGLAKALEYGEGKEMIIVQGGLRPVMVDAIRAGESWDVACQVLDHCARKVVNAGVIRDTTGSVLFEILKTNKKKPDWSAVGEILDTMKMKGLFIRGNLISDLRSSSLLAGAPGHLIEKVESIGDNERPAMMTRRGLYSDMTMEGLKEALEKDGGDRLAKKYLLMKSCTRGDVEGAERLKAELDEAGYVFPPIVIRQMAFLYSFHARDLEKTKEYITRLETEHPDYTSYTKVVLQLAELHAEKGQEDEVMAVTKRFANAHGDTVKEHGSSLEFEQACAKLVEAASSNPSTPNLGYDLLHTLVDLGYLPKVSSQLLKAYVDGLLHRDSSDDVIDGLEKISQEYKQLAALDEVCCRLIDQEDPTRLQKVVDIATGLYGEMKILHHLIVNFIKCGHPKKAKQILETPGLRAIMPFLTSACDSLVVDDKIDKLEQLVDITKNMFAIDREEMLFQLIRGYVRQMDYKRALNVLTMYEEENVQTRHRTLRYMAKVLQGQNLEVPFDVPQPMVFTEAKTKMSGQESELFENISDRNWNDVNENLGSLDIETIGKVLNSLQQRSKSAEIRSFFSHLGSTSNISLLNALDAAGKIPPGTNIVHKQNIFLAYVNSDKADELLSLIEKDIANMSHYLTDRGVALLAEKSPENFQKLESVIYKSMETNNWLFPLNILWSYYFINQSPKADEIMQAHPDMKKRLRVNNVCQNAIARDKPELLESLVSLLRGQNIKSLMFVYTYLFDYHCGKENVDAVLSTVKQATDDGVDMATIRKGLLQKMEALLTSQNKTIPWNVTKSGIDDSSDSSSSSDDEKR